MADDLTTNATDPDMATDDAAIQPLHAQLLTLGTEWRSQHIPTERLAMHIRALATHEKAMTTGQTYPLQQEEFVLLDTPPLPHRRLPPPRRYIISTVAAIMVVALLGAAFLVLARKAPGSHLPAATLTLPSATVALIKAPTLPFTATAAVPVDSHPLRSLHMIDATTGWAQTDQKILRTIDGGVHWHDVTPPGIAIPPQNSVSLTYTALDGTVAWASDGKTIYRTTNDGQTWLSATPTVGKRIGYLTFVDALHGWAIDYLVFGEQHEPLNILQTVDGGAHWAQISKTDAPGGLPSAGAKTGPVFVNAHTGWFGVETYTAVANLYVTHDGGVTWQVQTLTPIANQYSGGGGGTGLPTFITAQDGALPVLIATGESTLVKYVYVTHDGGASWSIAGTEGPGNGSDPYFLDMYHWWDIGGQNGNDLTYTIDGGQHWTTMTPGGTFSNMGQLDFVSPTLGWASTPNYSSLPTVLLRTSDGGHTWQQIDYQVG